jgi:cytoskeletal protein RodZ
MMIVVSMRTDRPLEFIVSGFGEKLRKQREQRGLSIDAISNNTKISPRMLRALEDERFEQLPGGVFNKGFVRAYARQVGLNEDEAINEYLVALRESQIQSHNILPNFRPAADKAVEGNNAEFDRQNERVDLAENAVHPPENGKKMPANGALRADGPAEIIPNRRSGTQDRRRENRRNADREGLPESAEIKSDAGKENLYDVAASSPLSFLNLDSPPSATRSADSDVEPTPDTPAMHPKNYFRGPVPWGTLIGALLLITLVLAFLAGRRHSALGTAGTATRPTPAATLPVSASASANAIVAAPPAAKPSPRQISSVEASAHELFPRATATNSRPAANSEDTDVIKRTIRPQAPPAATKPLTFTLLIRAERTSWVSITADGQAVAQETLIAPAHTSVRASHEIVVKVGNAAGISFLLNGREIPAGGSSGEVRTYSFDASGLRTSAALQPTNLPH